MTIAFDSVQESGGGATTGDDSYSITVPDNSIIVVAVRNVPSSDGVGAVTVDGNSLTELTGSPFDMTNVTESTNSFLHMFWYPTLLASGTYTLTVADSGSALSKNSVCFVATTAGGNAAIADNDFLDGVGANPTGSLSVGGNTCLSLLFWWSGQNSPASVDPNSGWTSQYELDVGSNSIGAYTKDSIDSSDVTYGITQTTEDYAFAAVALYEVGGGADSNFGSSGSTQAVAEDAESAESFTATANAVASITISANSSYAVQCVAQAIINWASNAESSALMLAICNISTQINQGAQAGDSPANYASVTTALLNAGVSDETIIAISTAAAAIVDAAESGDSWLTIVNAIGSLAPGAISDDDWQRIVDGIGATTIQEDSQSGAQFLASVQAIGQIIETANAGESLAVTCTALGLLAAGTEAADIWTATDLGIGAIAKSIATAANSSGLFTAAATISANITEGAIANAIFTAPGFGATGALLISSINLVASLRATLALDPTLDNTSITLEPNA